MSKAFDGLLAVVGDIHGITDKLGHICTHIRQTHERDGIDAVLVTGDVAANVLPTRRRPTQGEEFLWRQDALRAFNILASVGVPVLWVPGNHDPREPYKLLKYDAPPIVQNIDRRIVAAGTWVIAGLGGSPDKFSWPYEWDEVEARQSLMDMGGADVLLTHTPAFGHCDKALRGEHCGSTAVNLASKNYGFVVSGHIHEAAGVDAAQQDGKTTFYTNAGALGKPYPTNGYLLLGKGNGARWAKLVDLESGWTRGFREKDGAIERITEITAE